MIGTPMLHAPVPNTQVPNAPLGSRATTYQYIPVADPPSWVGSPLSPPPNGYTQNYIPFVQQHPYYLYSSHISGPQAHVDQVAPGVPFQNATPYQAQPVLAQMPFAV
jgi:hypothetical protein